MTYIQFHTDELARLIRVHLDLALLHLKTRDRTDVNHTDGALALGQALAWAEQALFKIKPGDTHEADRFMGLRQEAIRLGEMYWTAFGVFALVNGNRADLLQQNQPPAALPSGKTYSRRRGPNQKLTPVQVLEIKRLLLDPDNTYQKVAPMYGVTPDTIRLIARGITWADVQLPDDE